MSPNWISCPHNTTYRFQRMCIFTTNLQSRGPKNTNTWIVYSIASWIGVKGMSSWERRPGPGAATPVSSWIEQGKRPMESSWADGQQGKRPMEREEGGKGRGGRGSEELTVRPPRFYPTNFLRLGLPIIVNPHFLRIRCKAPASASPDAYGFLLKNIIQKSYRK
jgi:hypothetical protein